jgi:hypothetical protein
MSKPELRRPFLAIKLFIKKIFITFNLYHFIFLKFFIP